MTVSEIDTAINALQAERNRITSRAPEPSTVESVYGKSLAELEPQLAGHLPLMERGEPVVRCPKAGEWYFDFCGFPRKTSLNFLQRRSRLPVQCQLLILHPRRRLVYPVIGEREPAFGERYKRDKGEMWISYGSSHGCSLILGEPTLEEY